MAKLEKSLDNIEDASGSAAKVLAKIDKGEGTMGKLVNDSKPHDDLVKILKNLERNNSFKRLTRYVIELDEAEGGAGKRGTTAKKIGQVGDRFFASPRERGDLSGSGRGRQSGRARWLHCVANCMRCLAISCGYSAGRAWLASGRTTQSAPGIENARSRIVCQGDEAILPARDHEGGDAHPRQDVVAALAISLLQDLHEQLGAHAGHLREIELDVRHFDAGGVQLHLHAEAAQGGVGQQRAPDPQAELGGVASGGFDEGQDVAEDLGALELGQRAARGARQRHEAPHPGAVALVELQAHLEAHGEADDHGVVSVQLRERCFGIVGEVVHAQMPGARRDWATSRGRGSASAPRGISWRARG